MKRLSRCSLLLPQSGATYQGKSSEDPTSGEPTSPEPKLGEPTFKELTFSVPSHHVFVSEKTLEA